MRLRRDVNSFRRKTASATKSHAVEDGIGGVVKMMRVRTWWKRIVFGFVFALCIAFVVSACGDANTEETTDDEIIEPDSPENLLKLVYAEMQVGAFDCSSPHYFGENRIKLYFDSTALGPEGTVGVCLKIKDDSETGLYTKFLDSTATPVRTQIEEQGTMARTMGDKELNFAEGTLTLSDGTQLHINRMVEHEGRWYVLTLHGYIRFY
jgi:hypothetical protein